MVWLAKPMTGSLSVCFISWNYQSGSVTRRRQGQKSKFEYTPDEAKLLPESRRNVTDNAYAMSHTLTRKIAKPAIVA